MKGRSFEKRPAAP